MMVNNMLDLMCRLGHVHIIQVNKIEQSLIFALGRESGVLTN